MHNRADLRPIYKEQLCECNVLMMSPQCLMYITPKTLLICECQCHRFDLHDMIRAVGLSVALRLLAAWLKPL